MNLSQNTIFSLLYCGLFFINACSIGHRQPEKPRETRVLVSIEQHGSPLYFKARALGEASQTRVDVWTHEFDSRKTISADKITAQVRFPSGKQETLVLLKQSGESNHFVGTIPDVVRGQYGVTIDVKSKEGELSQTLLFVR